MKITFNSDYFKGFLIVLIVEILIAVFISQGFIRHTLGDFLVVVLLYCLIKSFIEISVIKAAGTVLLISFIIEFLQYFKVMRVLNVSNNPILSVVLGSTFSIPDLLAYIIGILAVVLVELRILNKS